MVGKTATDVAQMATQLYEASQHAAPPRYNQPASQAYQPPQQWQQPAAPQPPTQDEWMQDAYQANLKQQAYNKATQIDPTVTQFAGMMAQQARQMARMQYADEFRRWGPEIDLRLNQVDPTLVTPQNIETVVQMVRGAHVDELAAERVEQEIEKRANAGALIRPGANGSQPSPPQSNMVEFDKLPPGYQELLKRTRVTQPVLDEFLYKTEVNPRGITLDQARKEWFERASKGDVLWEEKYTTT